MFISLCIDLKHWKKDNLFINRKSETNTLQFLFDKIGIFIPQLCFESQIHPLTFKSAKQSLKSCFFQTHPSTFESVNLIPQVLFFLNSPLNFYFSIHFTHAQHHIFICSCFRYIQFTYSFLIILSINYHNRCLYLLWIWCLTQPFIRNRY